MSPNLSFHGHVVSVQPRVVMYRSFDERSFKYLGYLIELSGRVADEEGVCTIGVSEKAHEKHRFGVGDEIEGKCGEIEHPEEDPAQYRGVTGIRVIARSSALPTNAPPWTNAAPSLETYMDRGARRLAARNYETRCRGCKWGCRMAVEMLIDHWNPNAPRRHRTETFCFGPKSCRLYSSGPPRKVPGRKGMVWDEENWVDEQETAGRGPDD